MCDKVVIKGDGFDENDLEFVSFDQTLENPSIEDVQNVISEGKHLLIVGAGGCGKTYLLKKLQKVIYTATTACAAELLEGCTVQSYIMKNRKPASEKLVCDEVSMMGSLLFEQLYEWANKGKKKA